MSKPRFTHDGWDARSYDLGAARERRRIRRALAWIVSALRSHGTGCNDTSEGAWFKNQADVIDAATRSATRGKR